MLVAPVRRSRLIAVLRRVAITWGPDPVRIWDRSSSKVTSLYPDSVLGVWAVSARAGGFLGWVSLRVTPGDGPELGYRFHRAAWGRGYATEAARALVDRAFAETAVERVWATTMAVNTRSRLVLERVGLRHVRTYHEHFDDPIPGTEQGEVEYAVTRPEWLA